MANDGKWEKVKKPQSQRNPTSSTPKYSKNEDKKSSIPQPKARKPLRENNNANIKNSNHTVLAKQPIFIPKTISDCNQAIGNFKSLNEQINTLKGRTPDRPNVWLNELVKYLVSKCNISEKSLNKDQYLTDNWIELTPSVEDLLSSTFKDDSQYFVKSHVRSALFHETLLNLAEDSCRNKPIAGYKIILQILAKFYSKDCIKSISDRVFFYASQAHAYRTNPNTCLPIIWAIGLPYIYENNLTGQSSLDVFESILMPILEFKPTNKYVVHYLSKILKLHQENPSKSQLFSPNITTKIIELTFTGNFDHNDANKIKDLVASLPISIACFETFLEHLDQKDDSFRNYLLSKLNDLLSSKSGNEICQIWSLNYRSKITESSLLLKYLIENLNNLTPSTKKLLAKTCQQFSKINKNIIQSSSSNDNKKIINNIEHLCEVIIEETGSFGWNFGGKRRAKKNSGQRNYKNEESGGVYELSYLGIFLRLLYYLTLSLFLLVLFTDLYTVGGHWNKTHTRNIILNANPILKKNVPKVELTINKAVKYTKTKVNYGYVEISKFAPEKFQILEENVNVGIGHVKKFTEKELFPRVFVLMEFIDLKATEGYIYLKSNQIDVKIKNQVFDVSDQALTFLREFHSNIHRHAMYITENAKFIFSDINNNGPLYLNQLKTDLAKFFYNFQLTLGKFLLNLKPKIISFYKYVITFCNSNFGNIYSNFHAIYVKSVYPSVKSFLTSANQVFDIFMAEYMPMLVALMQVALEHFLKYWQLLVDQFMILGGNIQELIHGFMN